MLELNEQNFVYAYHYVRAELTPDLLPKKYRERNKHNPAFGHCHTAAAAMQLLFGKDNIKLFRGKDDEGIWHWWARVPQWDNMLVDITASQYYATGRRPPYDKGERASILGFDYLKRAKQVAERVEGRMNGGTVSDHDTKDGTGA